MRLILPDRSERDLATAPATVDNLLRELGISPPEVLVCRNGMLVPEDACLDDSDEVRLIRIAHGG